MSQNPPPHRPNRLKSYLETHETVLAQLRSDGFVGEDNIRLSASSKQLLMYGEIACLGGIVVRVEKALRILESNGSNSLVETDWYAYNVSVRNVANVFRYDNQDVDFTFREGHQDRHHKHVFDWTTGDELEVQWVGADNWPKLNQVIEEARDWYWANKDQLPEPDRYPAIDLR
ncbi:MAG: hypothetical protein AAFP20_11025 [Cyanobacteria bacterium J06614_10]